MQGKEEGVQKGWVDLLSPMTSTEGTAETVGEDGLLVLPR
jgi:hypothetical protein